MTTQLIRNGLRPITLAAVLAGMLVAAQPAEARGRGHHGRAGFRRGGHRVSSHHGRVSRGHHRRLGHHGNRGIRHGRRGLRGHHRSHRARLGHHGFHFRYGYYRQGHRYYKYPHSYRYSYGYPRYRYPYDRRGYGADRQAAAYKTEKQTKPGKPASSGKALSLTRGSGWPLLRNGRYEEALGAFANEAARHPKDGAIKVGYALAVAHMNRERGVWAMRRALRIDPDALHYMELDDKLTYRVHGLIEAYGRALEDASPGPDETFMVAALHYLLRDRGAAQESIHRAGRDGAASTKNLARLIGEMPGAKKVPHKNEAGARKPERKKDAKPATRGSPDAATAPPRKRGKDY